MLQKTLILNILLDVGEERLDARGATEEGNLATVPVDVSCVIVYGEAVTCGYECSVKRWLTINGTDEFLAQPLTGDWTCG